MSSSRLVMMTKAIQRFAKKHLHLAGVNTEQVVVCGLPNSEAGYCIRNVDEFCQKATSCEPVLCWAIYAVGGGLLANLHAVIRCKGKLRDITPCQFGLKTRQIIVEERMTVEEARAHTVRREQTFMDITNIRIAQEAGIDFLKLV